MIDAVVIGRVGIDLYPNELSTPLREVRTYTRFVGGFAGNVATGLARLGVRAAIVSRVGDEGHGEFVRAWLAARASTSASWPRIPYWQTPPTFCEVWPPDRFPITFYRRPTAPGLAALAGGLRRGGGRGGAAPVRDRHRPRPVAEPRDDARGAARAPRHDDLRPRLAARRSGRIRTSTRGSRPRRSAAADVVIGNEEEVEAARSSRTPRRSCSSAASAERPCSRTAEETDVPGFPVEVVNGLGAGDAFAAAVGHGLLNGFTLVEAVRRGTVAGAIVASRLACSEAMPRLDELEAALV